MLSADSLPQGGVGAKEKDRLALGEGMMGERRSGREVERERERERERRPRLLRPHRNALHGIGRCDAAIVQSSVPFCLLFSDTAQSRSKTLSSRTALHSTAAEPRGIPARAVEWTVRAPTLQQKSIRSDASPQHSTAEHSSSHISLPLCLFVSHHRLSDSYYSA
jgi:hypothetical protein